MLLETYRALSEHLDTLLYLLTYSVLTQVLAFTSASFLVWRLWTFTIRPALHPSAPKPLPYWIPFIGHAWSFISGGQRLVEDGKKYFGNSGDPFALTIAGQTLYIVTSPEDIGAIYKNNVTLSWDTMLNELLNGFGISTPTASKLWNKVPLEITQRARSDMKNTNPRQMSAVHSILDLYKRQLLPGPKFEVINKTLLAYINKFMTGQSVCAANHRVSESDLRSISLLSFCSNILVDAVTRALFGDGIYELKPDMTQHLLEFNQDAWMLIFQYPQRSGSRVNVVRRKLLTALRKYIQGPASIRAGQSWLIEHTLDESLLFGVPIEDCAAMLLMIYWAANINPYRLAFWMLSYILFTPGLINRLRTESSPAYQNGEIDVDYVMTQCPLLESVYHETLRLCNGALSARKTIAPTHLRDKVLKSNSTIIIPFRQLHHDQEVFGSNSARFDPERFLKDKSLTTSWSFRPFGGGINFCPGRFLAKTEMMTFIALAVNRFDISLPQGYVQQFPKLDTTTPALGVNGGEKGQDLIIDLKVRV